MKTSQALRARRKALWSGRSGLVNTVACFALALPLAVGLRWFAEKINAEPLCRAYGEAHRLAYVDVQHYSRDESTTVCLFTQAGGETEEVPFQKLAPFFTDLWVSFALDLKFTLAAFTALFAILRTLVLAGPSGGGEDASR